MVGLGIGKAAKNYQTTCKAVATGVSTGPVVISMAGIFRINQFNVRLGLLPLRAVVRDFRGWSDPAAVFV